MKTCNKCLIEKPLDDFHKNVHGKQGRATECKPCRRLARQETWANDPDYVKKCNEATRNSQLIAKYGIDSNTYDKMQDDCKGVCECCGKPETDVAFGKTRKLAVDHCHTTGKVRGLLCRACNIGLGHFNDDPVKLQQAINYIKESKCE